MNVAPGDAIVQVSDNPLWVARPFGPRDPITRQDLFEDQIISVLSLPGVRTTFFVDDWNFYHRRSGEVHCGTGIVRLSPNELFDHWWEFEP